MTHTPEPWRIEEGTTLIWGACDPDDQSTHGMGYPITDCRTTPSGKWAKGPDVEAGAANASRIVACVNALAGIPTDKLRPGIVKELIDAARVSQSDGDVDEIWTATDRLDALLRELGSE